MSKQYVRPTVGVHSISVSKIKFNGKAVQERVDEQMTLIEEMGILPNLKVTWDAYDWKSGHVFWDGDPNFVTALRELGHLVVMCEVGISPESGLRADTKEVYLEVHEQKVVNG